MRLSATIAGFCLLVLSVAGPAAADDKDTIQQARSAYYGLASRGFDGLQCNAAPNWEIVLADQIKSDPTSAQKALTLLRQIKFTVATDGTGTTKVTHNEVAASNAQAANGLKQIYAGMEQAMSGFFDTWAPFVINSPFPVVDSDYKLEQQGSQTILTYKEGSTAITTTMDKDFVIKAISVVSPDFRSTLRPQITKSAQGFLMTGYQADYIGKTPDEATRLTVRIAYQEVNGLQIPKTLNLAGTYGGSPFKMELGFSGCQVTKH